MNEETDGKLERSRLLRLSRSGWLVASALAITTVLWTAGHRDELASDALWPWRGPSQLVMLWSATLASLAILAVVRAQALEPLFGGLDTAVRLHRRLGLAAFILLGLHAVLLGVDALVRGESVAAVLVPFTVPGPRALDIIGFYLLVGLGILAYDQRMRHERWLALHRLVGVLFLLGTLHAAFEPGTIHAYEPLRTWIVILLLVGAMAWSYRVLLFRRFGPHYRYQVQAVVPRGGHTVDLVMRPLERRMMFEPGTFVFVGIPSFQRRERELHPFSISSSPLDRHLRVSIRQIGDFTQEISTLSLGEDNPNYWKSRRAGRFHSVSALRGADIDVYGPFGKFTPHRFQQYRRMVWVGSGIGITPFLSMLAFGSSTLDLRQIWLYYVVREAKDAVYDQEIRECHSKAGFAIQYVRWVSSERGRITAEQIVADVKREDYAVMICGSMPVVHSLTAQFRALRVPRRRIITEEFEFRGGPAQR
ncbi:MAG TPA: ferric reductase-like transmembrane domain-containing protein [Vicinamibacterales bacterium]|nr:ferric reductase-like transmembrane domain-containing protein [Vicinamibacterales bacterium]